MDRIFTLISDCDAMYKAVLCTIANDPGVPVSEAEQTVENLRGRGVFVKYLCYGDEGHGLMKMADKLDCYPQVVQFLKQHLL